MLDRRNRSLALFSVGLRPLTRRLVLNTNAVSPDESISTVTVEGALLVDAGLVESGARDRLITAFIYICARKQRVNNNSEGRGKVPRASSAREEREEALRPHRDTSPLSICSHVHISCSGRGRSPCSPHTPGHSLWTTEGHGHLLQNASCCRKD